MNSLLVKLVIHKSGLISLSVYSDTLESYQLAKAFSLETALIECLKEPGTNYCFQKPIFINEIMAIQSSSSY